MKKLFNYLKTIKHIRLYSIIAGILSTAIIVGSVLVIINSNNNKTQGVFTVTFANPDGSVIKTMEKEYGDSLTPEEYPDESEVTVNAGMKFVGWDTSYIEYIIEDVVITALQKSIIATQGSVEDENLNEFVYEAEDAINTASTGKEVQISETESRTVKSLYFKQDKTGIECVVTNEYAIQSTKDVELKFVMVMGHRSGGTHKISDLMTIELSHDNGATYSKYACDTTFTNTHWLQAEGGIGEKYGDMVSVNVGTMKLKKGINRILITGIHSLYLNLDCIKFQGDISGLSISTAKAAVRIDGSSNADSKNTFTIQAEDAINTASTGKEVQISETEKGTVKSLYFKQDKSGTECVITNEYAIASTKDVSLVLKMKIGHRKGGTNKFSDMMTIEISNDNGATYAKYNTDASVTNVHWMPEFGAGDKYGDMAIATLGNITLKTGVNRIRITGNKGLYANLDWIRFEGDISGLSISNEKPSSESVGSDLNKAFTYEAEDAINTASTGKEVQISETEKGTVKSLYFKQDKSGTECVITNEYAIASTKDVQLTFLMKLGNRKGGTNKVSDQFNIEISYDNGATYTKYNTDASITNVHWMPEFGAGDKYGDMAITTLGNITLKTGVNRIRITGNKGLYANLDWIRFEGDISGLSVSNEKPVTKMYTIRFNNPDGTLIKSIEKEENSSLVSSEYPLVIEVSLAEGKEFDGWDIASISKITKDAVITAKQKDIDKTKITLQAEEAKYSSNTGTNVIISDTENLTVKSVYMNNGQVTIDYKIVITGNTNQEYGLLIRMGHRSGGLRKLSDMLTFELKTSGSLNYSKFDSTGYIYNVAWTEKWGDMDDADVAIITLKPGENHLRIVGNLALYANIDSITLFGDATKISEEESVEKSYKFEAENAKYSGTNVSTIVSNCGSKGKSVYMNNGVVTIDYTIYLTEDATFKWDITLGHRNSGTHNLSEMLTFKVKTALDTDYSILATNSSVTNNWVWLSGDNETMMGTANVGTISLKAGENHLCIVGINSLPVNVDYITLIGDTDKIQQKLKIEAEQAKCVAGSSATPTISTCGSGAASVYMYGDTKGVVYVDFTINSASDVEVNMNAVLGHRDSGTHKLSDMFYIDVKDASSQEYKSVTTNGEVTNNWVWLNGDNETMMGTANVGVISLKAGENHIRIKAKSNYIRANLDYIVLLGDISGLNFVPYSQN